VFAKVTFPSVSYTGEGNEDGKLVLDAVPFGGKGSLFEIDKAFDKMEDMVHMLGVMEGVRDKYKPVFEFLKFLYLQLLQQFSPGMYPAKSMDFDVEIVRKVMAVVEIRPSEKMIRDYFMRVEPGDKSESVCMSISKQIRADIAAVRGLLMEALG
jgi:hypothetical protein